MVVRLIPVPVYVPVYVVVFPKSKNVRLFPVADQKRFREAIELPDPSTATTAITPLAGDRRHIGRTITMGIPRIWISPAT